VGDSELEVGTWFELAKFKFGVRVGSESGLAYKLRVGTRVSAAHSRGPAGPVVHRSHSSRLAEREGLGSFGDDCGLSQSSGRPIMMERA
jgi:hypothetical protein